MVIMLYIKNPVKMTGSSADKRKYPFGYFTYKHLLQDFISRYGVRAGLILILIKKYLTTKPVWQVR